MFVLARAYARLFILLACFASSSCGRNVLHTNGHAMSSAADESSGRWSSLAEPGVATTSLKTLAALLAAPSNIIFAWHLPLARQERRQLTRRQSVAALAAAVAATLQIPDVARAASPVKDGMNAFKAGKVEESIKLFDSVIKQNPDNKPYLWQRGLSLYYADRFEEGAEQFATDVAVNPNDTEESLWNLLCVARMEGLDKARKNILKVGFDRRPVMRAAQTVYSGETDEEPLKKFASSKDPSDIFYGNLYLGLYKEAQGDATAAKQYITLATDSVYGKISGDYMADLAKVHRKRRGW